MRKMTTLAAALAATLMLSATPLMAKDITIKTPEMPKAPSIETPEAPKTDLKDVLSQKAKDAVDNARDKADQGAGKLKKQMPGQKQSLEDVNIQQESVTVETPSGAAQETETTITPAAPAK